MGTSNFYKQNANLYYVVLMGEDEWDIEMEMDWISDILQKNGFDLNTPQSDILATKTKTFSYLDMNFYVSIRAKINPGYYEGATLDWDVMVQSDWYSVDSYTQSYEEEILDFIGDAIRSESVSEMDSEMVSNISDKIQSTINELVSETETIFESVSTYKLTRLGTFSNGESIYQEV